MFYELKQNKEVIEIENLVKRAEDYEDDLSTYVLFMKERILNVSGNN